MTHYDLVVIGSGSGNSLIGPEMDDWSVAIVEEGTFGGTCLNVGCIPTKMFVYPAEIAYETKDAARLGVDAHVDQVRWRDIRDRIFGRIDPISAGGRDYRRDGKNTTLYEAHATFTGERELSLSTGETITADRIVIATGSRAFVPPHIRDSGVPYYTSDTVMRIDELPRRVTILGGGYIAAEFANIFSSFGSEVTIVARSSGLLRELDTEVADAYTAFADTKWDLRMGRLAEKVTRTDGGVLLSLDDGTSVETDLLLVAVGRMPNAGRLGLDKAGVHVRDDGRVKVDMFQRTSAEGVWALGDVSSDYQLKHVANHESRIVGHNLTHPDALRKSDHRYVPAAVFTHPQLASVGLTEQQAAATGQPFVCATQKFGDTAYGWAMEDTVGICKLVANPMTGHLLGAHLMGEQASVLIQPIVQAMSFGLGIRDMAQGQYWIHPALSEVIENALLKLDLD